MPYFQNRFLNPREPRYDWLDAMPKGACVAQQPYQIPPLPTVWPENVDLWGAAWPNGLPEAGASSFDGQVPLVSSVNWTTARGQSGLGGLLPFAEVGEWFDFVKVGVILAGGLIGGYLVGYLWRELRTPRATNRRKRNRRRRRNARRVCETPVALGEALIFTIPGEADTMFVFEEGTKLQVNMVDDGCGETEKYAVPFASKAALRAFVDAELQTKADAKRLLAQLRRTRNRRNVSRSRRRNSETAKWRGYDDGFAGRAAQPPKGVWEREAYEEGYAMGRREKTAERGVARRYHEV